MFSNILVTSVIPEVLAKVLDNRKKIIHIAYTKNRCGGKGTTWAFKKRQTLTRIPNNIFKNICYDSPTWNIMFGCLAPHHIKHIVKALNWNDQRLKKLSQTNRFLLWIRRLRLACTHANNATLFGISASLSQLIFEEVTTIFLNKYKNCIKLPSIEAQESLKSILLTVSHFFVSAIFLYICKSCINRGVKCCPNMYLH